LVLDATFFTRNVHSGEKIRHIQAFCPRATFVALGQRHAYSQLVLREGGLGEYAPKEAESKYKKCLNVTTACCPAQPQPRLL